MAKTKNKHKYQDYAKAERDYYENMLKVIGSLSRLFSENNAPYLDSRVAENLYCKSFNAENKSRDDSSIDAVYRTMGIGIKTFVGNSAQKIAEFNKDLVDFSNLPPLEKAKKIAELRNKRIEFTKRAYSVDDLQYHCIRREKGIMILCESSMDIINIEKIKISDANDKSVKFSDSKNKYNFNISKSVLLKDFPKSNIVAEIKIDILKDPFNILERGIAVQKEEILKLTEEQQPFVILPLYSLKDKNKVVPEKSGLNQWNAGGRTRNEDEVYIPIPHWIHDKFPRFFPKSDTKFKLKLPNGVYLSAKICQDNDKALMSDPNKTLGVWVLRSVLQLKRGELATYKMLQEVGIDSVIIKKISSSEYSIDFREEGEFERFKMEHFIYG